MPSPHKTAEAVPAHLSSKSDNWPTPVDFFAALDAEFGFVLDVCASTTNHKANSFYALDHPDEARRDGLAADWAADSARLGGAAWMNPPYGRPISAWMAKAHAAARAGATVVTLVPVRADTTWWHEHVLATGAEVRYVRGRLTFGDAVNTAAFASAVVIYRPADVAGAPGPVNTMPAHPVAAAARVPAAVAAAVHAPVVVAATVRQNTPPAGGPAAASTPARQKTTGSVTRARPLRLQSARRRRLTATSLPSGGPCRSGAETASPPAAGPGPRCAGPHYGAPGSCARCPLPATPRPPRAHPR